MRRAVVLTIVATQVLSATPAFAQWVKLDLPSMPRTTAGQVDLNAPTPRRPGGQPDLSGVWAAVADRRDVPPGAPDIPRNRHAANIGVDIPGGAPLTAWAREVREARQKNNRRELPTSKCLPSGIPPDMLRPTLPFKIVQADGIVVVLLEEFNNWRQILTDGRALPVISAPGSFGYSIGRWEGDVFAVTTVGISEQTWLDSGGTPHTEELRLTEKYTRPSFGRMEVEYTFDDPKTFTRVWSTSVRFELQPELEIMDHQCEVNRLSPVQR